ncbi:transglycosylase SLT domain-containing protein [Gemmatimonas sp.]|uniref:transglycosylase SLT domain-containing protein n=1 Tax=Gemmatimonas sp. TaxID=1962908 RepID=UPI0025C63528|nr:transglycosylase SLT domain-containing protein [Gemmatimonas sp.]MCE2952823.1 transglycosylase SLT domain-containing protein [Gemmatimonas sp.]
MTAPQQEALVRRERLLRRRAQRRIRQAIVASAAAFTGVLLLNREGAPADSVATTSTSAPAAPPASAPGSMSLLRPAPLAAQPIWRRPGEILKREKTAAAPAFAFGTDPRLKERHESLNRWHHIYNYSAQYRIKPDLARRIYDAAIAAGIEPELGFRLVRVESVFDPKAESPAGALGLTQLMPSTARVFEPNVTREQLLTADVNLRIGFRYLRGLIREYKGDLKLALLVYNRGPVAVGRALAMGKSPANGYETIVTKGYRGRGTLD